MVDFNNETTIATPAVDIERVLILQKRENYLEAWESYLMRKGKHQLGSAEVPLLRARLSNLYYQLHPLMHRICPREEVEWYEKDLLSDSPETLHEVFKSINAHLNKIGLTRIDRESLGGNIVKRNKAAGLL